MPKIPLIGGNYTARSVIAMAQRAVNLYAEKNPEDAEAPFTQYPTPGLVLLSAAPAAGGWRGIYQASNNEVYGVVGSGVYLVSSAFGYTLLGSIAFGTTPVSMKDNGIDLVIVDGTTAGYTVNLTSHAFAAIADVDFLGSNFVDYLDTFLLFNQPGTKNFYSSGSNAVTFDPLDIGAKTANPDLLVAARVTHRDIWLIGQKTTEIWYNAGTSGFPFAITPGAYVDHGCGAPYSIITHGSRLFWVSRDKDGITMIYRAESYKVQAISTPSISTIISAYSTVEDCVAWVYQQESHIFLMFNFPSANDGRGATWCYDEQTGFWHERVWTDSEGLENRHRGQCGTAAFGKILVGDWENSNLYELSLDAYTDFGGPIVYRRGFPPIVPEGKRVSFGQFAADMECGTLPDSSVDDIEQPQVFLRWSDDGGKTWGNAIGQSLGALGQYNFQPQWTRLGYSRRRVFELFWSVPAKTALNGAYLWPPVAFGS